MIRVPLRPMLFALWLAASAAHAQDEREGQAASLVADNVAVVGENVIVASGNVEVFHGDIHLRARSIRFDDATGRLSIEGPITLTNGPEITLLAEQAELDADIENGILLGARMMLNQQFQIASAEAALLNGRHTRFHKTVASSCEVCARNPVPLWSIRAREIIHDKETRRIHFTNAQFRVVNVPIAHLPRLSLPDPTVKRATGFLRPEIQVSDKLGAGIKTPYFIVIDPSRDLTLTPFVTTSGSRTLEARYRQAFTWGNLLVEGASTDDDIRDGEEGPRGFLHIAANAALPRDFELAFDLESVSDPEYPVQYGYPYTDTLETSLVASRTREDEHVSAGGTLYESLRPGDNNSVLPTRVADGVVVRRVRPARLGGLAEFRLAAHNHHRNSDADGEGRDIDRLSGELDWRRSWIIAGGFVGSTQTLFNASRYDVDDDSSFPTSLGREYAMGAAELRLPLVAPADRGNHLLEPVVQVVAAPDSVTEAPNDDSHIVEFDEGNLYSFSRFPGEDGVELGNRANFGVAYTRHVSTGWNLGLSLGRVIRERDLNQFTAASGLDSRSSDWLTTAKLETRAGLSATNRAVVDDDSTIIRNELEVIWSDEDFDISSAYTWLEADVTENRARDTSELAVLSEYQLTGNWSARGDVRYDFEADRATASTLGFGYGNECIDVEFDITRTYSATTREDTNNFSLRISLGGIGESGTRARGVCRNY